MKYLLSLMLCWTIAAAAPAAPAQAAAPAEEGKLRILLTYGGHAFEEQQFFAMFDAMPGVVYTKAQMPQDAGLLKPGLEKQCDVIVRYDMVPAVTPDQQKAFVDLLNTGIGLVSLHHNLAAHRDWDEFPKIIGGKFFVKDDQLGGKTYAKSGWSHGEDMKITVADKDHPITRGLKDFQIHDESYNEYYTAPNVRVLLKTDYPKNDPDVAWVTEYGKSRVFYLMLGHDHLAWENPDYIEILSRGIRWAAGKQ